MPSKLTTLGTFALMLTTAPASAGAQSADSAQLRLFRSIDWVSGPVSGALGAQATVQVPASCRFTGADGAAKFMEATENPPSGNEEGVLLCQDDSDEIWFAVFSFDPSGYVKDDQGASLDSTAILESLQKGAEATNQERRKRGWSGIHVVGWQRAPYYDESTHNLTWATRLRDDEGGLTINHSVRLLGRSGVMHADLVADPSQMASAVPAFNDILGQYRFKEGHRYAEFRQGDKVASYGLTALIAGGVGAAAVKTGLLAKAWKLIVGLLVAAWKFLVAIVAGIAAWIKKVFGGGKKRSAEGSAGS